MQFLFITVFGCLCAFVFGTSSPCSTPNGEEAQCVSLRKCPILLSDSASDDFVDASACGTGRLMVCCGTSADFTTKAPEVTTTTEVDEDLQKKSRRQQVIEKHLPNKRFCGMQHWDDYYHLNNETESFEASVDEFPWLGFIDLPYSCNAFLISSRYMLSTPHCLYLGNKYELKLLLGVHHFHKNVSCVPTRFGDDCTEENVEVSIEKEFNITENIALVKLTKSVYYSDFIRPVCLPFEDYERPKINDTGLVSGWKIFADAAAVPVKQRTPVQIVSNEECCNSTYYESNGGYMCVLSLEHNSPLPFGFRSGGPIMYKYRNNWFAAGIISTSDCERNNRKRGFPLTPEILNQVLDLIASNGY